MSANPGQIACPVCPAEAGQRCHNSTWPPSYHPERERAAQEQRVTLPDEPSVSKHYAIRLPNGKLCSEIPNDLRVGLVDLRVMPTGDHAYLWPDNNEGGARATIGRIADTMKRFGAKELFERNAHVVRVVLTAEVIGPTCTELPDVGQ